jgi:hypothetical protein
MIVIPSRPCFLAMIGTCLMLQAGMSASYSIVERTHHHTSGSSTDVVLRGESGTLNLAPPSLLPENENEVPLDRAKIDLESNDDTTNPSLWSPVTGTTSYYIEGTFLDGTCKQLISATAFQLNACGPDNQQKNGKYQMSTCSVGIGANAGRYSCKTAQYSDSACTSKPSVRHSAGFSSNNLCDGDMIAPSLAPLAQFASSGITQR